MNLIRLQALVLLGVVGVVLGAGQPLVEISKECPELRYLGRPVTFEVKVVNRGDGPALNVVVRDAVTAGLTFVSADQGGRLEGGQVVWALGELPAGQSRTLSTTLRCDQIGTVTNTATVAYCAENSATCSFPIQGVPAILLECVDNPDPVEVGGQVTYTITVLNQGTAIGTAIVIACTLPNELELATSKGPTAAAVDGKKVTFAPLATLAPKASAVYTLTAKGTAAGDVRFAVELTSDQLTRPVRETESTHLY